MIPRDEGRRRRAPNENAGGQAVLPWQIEQWNLPSRPTKQSDSRAKRFGDRPSVELDAIHPETLRELVAGAIAEHMPAERCASLMAKQATERATMREWAGQMSIDKRDAP